MTIKPTGDFLVGGAVWVGVDWMMGDLPEEVNIGASRRLLQRVTMRIKDSKSMRWRFDFAISLNKWLEQHDYYDKPG